MGQVKTKSLLFLLNLSMKNVGGQRNADKYYHLIKSRASFKLVSKKIGRHEKKNFTKFIWYSLCLFCHSYHANFGYRHIIKPISTY